MSSLIVQYLELASLNVATLNVTSRLIGNSIGDMQVTGDLYVTGNVFKTSGISVFNSPEVPVTANAYTIQVGDVGKFIVCSNTGNTIITVANNATVPIANNERIDLLSNTAGAVTVAAGAGVTIRSFGGKLKLTGQGSAASLWKKGTDEWFLIGDITF